MPSFDEGLRAQLVLDALVEAAAERRWVEIPSLERSRREARHVHGQPARPRLGGRPSTPPPSSASWPSSRWAAGTCRSATSTRSRWPESQAARDALLRPVAERGMEIAALGCYGNFLDPDPDERARQQADLRAAIRAAAELGIRTVTSNAGCPPGAPGDASPNWIVNSLFPSRWDEAYRWQWEACVLPFWEEMGRLAEEHDVGAGARADGRRRGLQPRHLQAAARGRRRADPVPRRPVPPVVAGDRHRRVRRRRRRRGRVRPRQGRRLPGAGVLRTEGWLPSCAYDDWDNRSWSMRAIGHGHDETFWRSYLVALRRAGYDGTVAIEFQEPYLSVEDGLRMSVELLRRAIPRDPAPSGNWFEMYADGGA